MTPAVETEGPVASTSSKPVPEVSKDKPKGPQKKQKGPKNHQGKGKGKANWHRAYTQGYRIPKLEPSAVDSVFKMARTLMGFTAKEQDRLNFSMQMIDEIHFVRSSIDVELGKFDAKILKDQVLEITKKNNQFATHLAKSDSERQKLKNEIIANVEQIHENYEPHMPRHSTPLNEEKRSVKESLTTFLGENVISAKDIPKLKEWPTFSVEGEYNHIEFIQTIDMLQEDFHIPDEIIVEKLHSLFTRTAKKWYYKMRQDHGKHDWSWWKSEMITKWANNSWRFKMENDFESAIFNSEKDTPLGSSSRKTDYLLYTQICLTP
ncbi:hypothetical protein O181_072379 [Austropuccinia psidii MF-1]|uniref:Retrotransposon gag domain-containing protein n=1 Tax=Austropuccinia psidii MF-1 TaxID=1389203 RepID=A0A9Q3F4N2_9BASI|nr:hypothetical protein [Austropuccinia psidii MF-1]